MHPFLTVAYGHHALCAHTHDNHYAIILTPCKHNEKLTEQHDCSVLFCSPCLGLEFLLSTTIYEMIFSYEPFSNFQKVFISYKDVISGVKMMTYDLNGAFTHDMNKDSFQKMAKASGR